MAWPVLLPNGHARGRRPLPDDDGDVLVEVEGLEAQVGQLGEPHAAVEEQSHDRHVASLLEPPALARRQQPAQLVVAQHRHRLVGDVGGLHARHRRLGHLALFHQVGKEPSQGPVAV